MSNEIKLWEKCLGIGILIVVVIILNFVYGFLFSHFGLVGVVSFTAFWAWYFFQSLEWALNGGGVGYPYWGWTQPFYAVWHGFRCFSFAYCKKYAGVELRDKSDEQWRKDSMEHANMLYESRWASLITPTIFLVAPIAISILIETGISI